MKTFVWQATLAVAIASLFATGCAKHDPANTSNTFTNIPSNQTMTTSKSATTEPSVLNVTKETAMTVNGKPAVQHGLVTNVAIAPEFLNAQQGFVVQSNELIYTADGGASWRNVPAAGGQIDAIAFTSPESGLVVTTNALSAQQSPQTFSIFKTGDRGAHWQKEWSGSGTPPDWPNHSQVFQFADGTSFAWAGGHILRQQNGSSAWTELKLPVPGKVAAVDFADQHHGWATIQQPAPSHGQATMSTLVVLQTTDGGIHWHVQYRTAPIEAVSIEMKFLSATDGLLLYKDPDKMDTVVYRTANAGVSWTHSSPKELGGRIIAGGPVITGGSVWIPMNAGAAPLPSSIVESDDMGKTWHTVTGTELWRQVALSARFGDTAYAFDASTMGSALLKTTDNGKTWSQVLPAPTPGKSMCFVSPTVGFALGPIGDENAILKTVDGGKTWSTVGSIPQGIQSYSIAFQDEENGYVTVTPNGASPTAPDTLVMETTDGGKSWSPASFGKLPSDIQNQISHDGASVIPAYFLPGKTGADWVIGTTGFPNLYTLTTDGETTKVAASFVSPPGALESYSFVSQTDGWMSVLHSVNPGTTGESEIEVLNPSNGEWVTKWTLPGEWAVEGIFRLSIKDAWIVAQDHPNPPNQTFAIFRTIDGGETWTRYEVPASISFTPPPTSWDAQFPICFVNSNDGWLLTEQGLLKTTDGGETWIFVG